MEDRIERGAVGAHPGLDGSVPPAPGAAARLMTPGRASLCCGPSGVSRNSPAVTQMSGRICTQAPPFE